MIVSNDINNNNSNHDFFYFTRASSANAVKEIYARPQSPPPDYTEFEPSPTMHHPNSPRRTRAPSGMNRVVRGSFGNNRVSSAVSHGTAPPYDRSMTPVF